LKCVRLTIKRLKRLIHDECNCARFLVHGGSNQEAGRLPAIMENSKDLRFDAERLIEFNFHFSGQPGRRESMLRSTPQWASASDWLAHTSSEIPMALEFNVLAKALALRPSGD
jgi:hypothetical protein